MTRAFARLDGRHTTYLIDCRGSQIPRQLYWGSRLADEGALAAALAGWWRRSLGEPAAQNLMPEHGIGFYGQPAILGARGSLDWTTQFQCVDVAVEADAVRVTCVDEPAALELRLELAIDPKSDVLRRCATITNTGSADYDVRWLASGAFALPEACDEILSFHGGWAAEFQSRRVPVDVGVWLRENRRGKTSRDCFPGLVAGGRGFDEDRGPVYGFHLGWSGNNRMLVEVQEDGRRQVQLGELLFPGEVVLAPGESYTNPWVYATAAAGLCR